MAAKEKTASGVPPMSLKVSPKGAVSLYGLGRFPITLYQEQWLAVIEKGDAIRSFIQANVKDLKEKPVGTVSGGTSI